MMVTKSKKIASQERSSKAILAIAVIVAITITIADAIRKGTKLTNLKILNDSKNLHSVYMMQKRNCLSEKHNVILNTYSAKRRDVFGCTYLNAKRTCKETV